MLRADELKNNYPLRKIDNKWVVARGLLNPFIIRIRDAWKVLIGKADAVCFYRQ
jgi:hypothetical protein